MNATYKNTPNLFLVGAQKCGTTSLHRYLASHPDIFMSSPKEPRFFCKDLIEESDQFINSLPAYCKKDSLYTLYKFRTIEDYLSLFDTSEKYKIYGEASPIYIYSKIAAKEIASFNPNAKIIILLRNPIEFLYSLHSTYLQGNTETEPSFEKALDLEVHRKNGKHIPIGVGCPSLLYYSEQTSFSEQIMRYITHFSTNQILVILQEDLRQNTAEKFNEILDFLEISSGHNPPNTQYNKNKVIKYPKIRKALTSPLLTYIPRKALPKSLYQYASNYLSRALQTTMERPMLDQQTTIRMKHQYRSEVVKLNELLNDYGLLSTNLLSRWGFDH